MLVLQRTVKIPVITLLRTISIRLGSWKNLKVSNGEPVTTLFGFLKEPLNEPLPAVGSTCI